MDRYSLVAHFACIISWLFMGLLIGVILGEAGMRHEAIEAGAAEHYLDENNNKQFRWLPAKEEE